MREDINRRELKHGKRSQKSINRYRGKAEPLEMVGPVGLEPTTKGLWVRF